MYGVSVMCFLWFCECVFSVAVKALICAREALSLLCGCLLFGCERIIPGTVWKMTGSVQNPTMLFFFSEYAFMHLLFYYVKTMGCHGIFFAVLVYSHIFGWLRWTCGNNKTHKLVTPHVPWSLYIQYTHRVILKEPARLESDSSANLHINTFPLCWKKTDWLK